MLPHPGPELRSRRMLVVSLLLLAAMTVFTLVARSLIPIDETRYVSVAWEMWLRGDFLVPFKNGETYSHKPPLMFWMMHLGWGVFGVNDGWPRLVMPLYSAGVLVLLHRLAGRLWPGQGYGGVAALILSGTLLWGLLSTATLFDAMLAFWVLLGVHGVLRAAEGRRSGFLLLGLGIGFGVLTKGPVVLLHLLPLAVLAPWWNASPSRPAWLPWYAGIMLAVALGAVIALAWAIPAGMAGGEAYRNAIFWGQTADRMVDSFAHRRPLWWYLPLLPLLLFPWLVWGGFWRALARQKREGLDRGMRFCLAWTLPVFVAFSFISGKQLLPAFALLTARTFNPRDTRVDVPALITVAIGLALIAVSSGLVPSLEKQVVQLPPLWIGIVLAGLGGVGWMAGRRGVSAVVTLAILGLGTLALVQLAFLRATEGAYDVAPLARAIRAAQDAGHPVANLGKYHAQYQFAGRLHAPLVELEAANAASWLQANPQGYVVYYVKDLRRLDGIPARFSQRYRGGAVALLDSRAAGLLGDHNSGEMKRK
jgi:4-amino-4-deoxy-L-arabinose transferase-like glycosyltransferase